MKSLCLALVASALCAVGTAYAADAASDAPALYQEHCESCHGAERLGGMGPALLPENLSRLRKNNAIEVIANGRPATQMGGFGETLSAADITALADMIYTPLAQTPVWGLREISASHAVDVDSKALPDKPLHAADPLNLFLVVEAGDHHVTILDGDTFEPLWRFESRFALHGGAKYSPDGRFVYLGSRDGWISKYDLHSFQRVAEIRAGINMRNIAVSADGRYVMAANYLPHSLVLLDALDLKPIKVFEVADEKTGKTSRVSAVYTAPPRDSFMVALKDIPEIWEISYADNPRPVAKGLVHNRQIGRAHV